jgi:hypothetical protein
MANGLDVLMIWHAFMWHPREYRSFIEERGGLSLSANLPWSLIVSVTALENATLTFNTAPSTRE